MSKPSSIVPPPQFPTHPEPRVWLLSSGASPIGIALSRRLLTHGDSVVFGRAPKELSDANSYRAVDFTTFWEEEVLVKEGWKDRARVISLDGRNMGQCQAAIADICASFRKLDILLCCSSETVVGSVEELGASPRTNALVRDQFETNYFGHVNIIKAALPSMREKGRGHIMLVTGISGHLGTPGLGMYCASQWAIEGFCDSLTYEVAPFNIRVTIIQPTIEIQILTNPITAVPQLPPYAPEANTAPLFREIIGGILDRLDSAASAASNETTKGRLSSKPTFPLDKTVSIYPQLSEEMKDQLLAETINALTAIGGHDNPPARHIVGHEAVGLVKEKLKTVSEELEDYVEVSCAVDLDADVANPQ
ncbi:MAG: hypothetical protein Q9208_008234 [Pyrenodesmia sp. 3 TL-2023]